MSAFTNPKFPRENILAEIQAKNEAGLLRQGPNGVGTIVDLLLKGDAAQCAHERYGMPQPFVFALDVIFNGLPREDAATWAIASVEAVTPKKDLSRVWAWMALATLKKLEAIVGTEVSVLNAAIHYVERRTQQDHDVQEGQDFLNVKATWDLVKEEDETLYIIKSAVLSTRPVSQFTEAARHADWQARALDAAAALRYTAKFIAGRAQQSVLAGAEDPAAVTAAASLAASNASEEVYTEFAARFTTIVTEAPEAVVSVAQRVASVAGGMNRFARAADRIVPQQPRNPNPPLPRPGPWGMGG